MFPFDDIIMKFIEWCCFIKSSFVVAYNIFTLGITFPLMGICIAADYMA